MKISRILIIAFAAIIVLALFAFGAQMAFADCDIMRAIGLPESCQAACAFGMRDAFSSIMCLFDILIGW